MREVVLKHRDKNHAKIIKTSGFKQQEVIAIRTRTVYQGNDVCWILQLRKGGNSQGNVNYTEGCIALATYNSLFTPMHLPEAPDF